MLSLHYNSKVFCDRVIKDDTSFSSFLNLFMLELLGSLPIVEGTDAQLAIPNS